MSQPPSPDVGRISGVDLVDRPWITFRLVGNNRR